MKHLIVVVAFAATTAAPSVMAAVYANASLSNIQYKLVDLDVNDGINPSVTFTSAYSYSALSGSISDNNSNSDSFNQNSTLNSLTSGAVSDSLNSASGSINYNDSYATNLQASGSTLGNTSGTYSYFQGQSIDQQYYTLSPNTRLELSADSNLSVETTSSSAYEYGYAINQSYFYDSNNNINNYFYTQLYKKNT